MEEVRDKKKLTQIVITIVLIFVFAILVIIKIQSPSFPLLVVVLGGILMFGGIFIAWKGADFFSKFKNKQEINKDELPPAITIEQAKEFINKQLLTPEYADYTSGWLRSRPYVVGKSKKQTVLLVQLAPTEYSEAPYQFFILNMHYPEKLWAYEEQTNYNVGELTRIIHAMVTDPEEEPDVKVTEEENPLLGTKRTITEKLSKKKAEKEKAKEEVKEE